MPYLSTMVRDDQKLRRQPLPVLTKSAVIRGRDLIGTGLEALSAVTLPYPVQPYIERTLAW